MSFNLNSKFLSSLLGIEHTFIPKITITDRARVSYNTMQDATELVVAPTVVEVDGIQKNADFIFSQKTINDKDIIFYVPQYVGTYVSGQNFNQIGCIIDGNVKMLDLNLNVPMYEEAGVDISGFTDIELCYNPNVGQAVLVYNAVWTTDAGSSSMARGVLLSFDENFNITQGADFTVGVEMEKTTGCILDNAKLMIVCYQNQSIYKQIKEVDLTNTENITNHSWKGNGDITLNAGCFTDGTIFYHFENFINNGITATRLFSSIYMGYTPVYSNYVYTDIDYYNGVLQGILAVDSGKFKLHELNLNLEVLKSIDFGEDLAETTVKYNDYLINNNKIIYNDNGIYTRPLSYETSYIEKDTEIELPVERIMKVDLDILNENAKSNTMKVTLNNGDGFFDSTGKNADGLYYKDFLNTERLSNRIVKFYLSDKEAVEDGKQLYDLYYTGILDVPNTGLNGEYEVNCVDYLEILSRANCRAKTYSNIQAEDVIRDLAAQAGVKNIVFKDYLNYTVNKYEVDRRSTVLDNIKKILDKIAFFIYVDNEGNIVISRRILYKQPAFTFDEIVVKDISKEGPYMGDARNVVRIITDNENDLYVEARDEEAIVNMGYECVAEFDYTGLYPTPVDESVIKYEVPTYEMLMEGIAKVDPAIVNDNNVQTFVKYACGLFGYHSRYLYHLKLFTKNGGVRTYLVSSEGQFGFIQRDGLIYAKFLNKETWGLNALEVDSGFLRCDFCSDINNFEQGVHFARTGSTGFESTPIYPNRDLMGDKKYDFPPERNQYIDFSRDLIKYLEKDCGMNIDLVEENYINAFVDKYKNSHELVAFVGHFDSAYPHIVGNQYFPMSFRLIAIKKDYTYITDLTSRMTKFVKDPGGRYIILAPIDKISKECVSYVSGGKESGFSLAAGGNNLKFNTNYGIADFKYHGYNNPSSVNGTDALSDAERLLKQLCRTMEYDTVKLSKPLIFIAPEDVIWLNVGERFKGYRTAKQLKHTFSFTDKNLYSGQVKLQHAIENVDFFIEEVEDE